MTVISQPQVGSKVDDVGTMVGTMHSDMSVEMQTLRNQLESMKSQQQEAAARQEALLLRAFESLQSAPLTAGMRGLDLSSAAPVALPPWTEEAVRRITGDFDEARLIARGGSAAIYWSDFNGQKLAVKRLLSAHGGLTNASELKKLVQNESSLLAKLQHQHIIRLFGTCVEPPCLIYGLCEGGTLAMHLGMDNASKRPPGPPVGSGTMPWQHRLRVMAEVSQALAYLHNCKPSSIYHRGDCRHEVVRSSVQFTLPRADAFHLQSKDPM